MENSYDYIQFSKGDLIVDRIYKEVGILLKKSRVLGPITEVEHREDLEEVTFLWG